VLARAAKPYLVSFRLGSLTFRDLPMLPLSGFSQQNLHTVKGVGDGLPFFWCSAVIFGKDALPFVYFRFRLLNALLHPHPIGLKQSCPVRFVPAICDSHANLANPPFWANLTVLEMMPFLKNQKLINFEPWRTNDELEKSLVTSFIFIGQSK
jgi:hypothetical protein